MESYEYLDVNKIDHWEISCKCGFKDKTTFLDSQKFNDKIALTGDFLGSFGASFALSALTGPIGWGTGIAIALAGIVSGVAGYFGGQKIGEKISESKNIGLDTFEKGCPKCGKLELSIIPIFKE